MEDDNFSDDRHSISMEKSKIVVEEERVYEHKDDKGHESPIDLRPLDSLKSSSQLLSKNTKKFNVSIKNYKSVQDNLLNTKEDIVKLEKIHHKFVTNAENKLRFHEYGTYIDDIYYQIKLLKLEYVCQEEIQTQNINKLYKDLYRLYNKVVKKVLSIRIENTQANLLGRREVNERFVSDRKPFYQKIKPFNEVKDIQINIDDCIILYSELETRLSDFLNAIQEIANSIMIAEEQKMDGLLLQTYLISLNSEKEKCLIEHEVFQKLLKGILMNHIDISIKYLERTNQISKEILNDTEKIKSI
jgi:hypothetical protein